MQLNKNSTLAEIIEYVTRSNSMEDRANDFLLAYNTLSFFKVFIDRCFFVENDMKLFDDYQLKTKFKPLDKSRLLTNTREVIDNYLPRLVDSSPMKLSTKYSLFSSLLEEVAGEDIHLLIGMVKGKYVGDSRINNLFLSKIFNEKKLSGV
jgi:hypothetical protein